MARNSVPPREWWCRDAHVLRESASKYKRSTKSKIQKRRGNDGDGKNYVLPNTYTQECQEHILRNETWGEPRAPFVCKHQSKEILKEMKRKSPLLQELRVIPTVLTFNKTTMKKDDFSLQGLLARSPEGIILKPTHTSGGVAKLGPDGTYECFKKCSKGTVLNLHDQPEETNTLAWKNIQANLRHTKSKKAGELQYDFVAPQIIVEPLLPLSPQNDNDNDDTAGLYHFWVVQGRVAYGQARCQTKNGGTFVTASFQPLPKMEIAFMEFCDLDKLKKPERWDAMVQIAQELGRQLQQEHNLQGLVRVDLYHTPSGQVWFSEFTFTSNQCQRYAQPVQADRLVYAMEHGLIDPSMVTPSFVRDLINNETYCP